MKMIFDRDMMGQQVLRPVYERADHCTHPEQTWCDCDWCRYLREHPEVTA